MAGLQDGYSSPYRLPRQLYGKALAFKDALAAIAPEIQFIIPEYNKWIEL